jgi:hypothetical protein
LSAHENKNTTKSGTPDMINGDERGKLLLHNPKLAYGSIMIGRLNHVLEMARLMSCQEPGMMSSIGIKGFTSCSSTKVQASPILPARAVLPTR